MRLRRSIICLKGRNSLETSSSLVRPITCVMLNVKVSLNLLANSIPAYPTPGLSADCGGHDFAKGRTMKRAYSKSQYAKPYERYCRELYPAEAEQIFQRAEDYYLEFMKDMPDLGENIMAKNMLDWFTILSFYEASGHRLDGEALLKIKRQMTDKMKFLGKFVDGNRQRWPYRLFERTYIKFIRMQKEHQAKGEWMHSWRVEINPEQHTEGFAFHLVGCPIVKHAKEHGYDKLLPYLCKTDHYLAEVMHARLIRTQTKALGGSYCDYWYVGDKSPVLEQYKDLEQI